MVQIWCNHHVRIRTMKLYYKIKFRTCRYVLSLVSYSMRFITIFVSDAAHSMSVS
jgi:hypothetical protein